MLTVDHHLAHAWSSYGLSGFDEALVIVIDGRGAYQSTTLYHATGDRLKPLRTFYFPNSLGLYYLRFTSLLGFAGNADEWKVMGLAPYGTPIYDLSDVLEIKRHGYEYKTRSMASLTQRFGPRRNPDAVIQDDMDLAASAQATFEQALLALVEEGMSLTQCRNVCLAGGAALNAKG